MSRYLATDKQKIYLAILLKEACVRLANFSTGIDHRHLERVSFKEAQFAIGRLLEAKKENYKPVAAETNQFWFWQGFPR